MLTVAQVGLETLSELACRYDLAVVAVDLNETIPGSYWGDPEAGLVRRTVYVREDTPVHSFLHEMCHALCMNEERRDALHTDAGGDDLEECAVCYLQVLLADQLPGVGRARLMHDMDSWGYSFRLGSTQAWFEQDADDARRWLSERGLLPEG